MLINLIIFSSCVSYNFFVFLRSFCTETTYWLKVWQAGLGWLWRAGAHWAFITLDDDDGEGYDLEGVEWEEGWDKKDDKGP